MHVWTARTALTQTGLHAEVEPRVQQQTAAVQCAHDFVEPEEACRKVMRLIAERSEEAARIVLSIDAQYEGLGTVFRGAVGCVEDEAADEVGRNKLVE